MTMLAFLLSYTDRINASSMTIRSIRVGSGLRGAAQLSSRPASST
jgi:hypothetical protein